MMIGWTDCGWDADPDAHANTPAIDAAPSVAALKRRSFFIRSDLRDDGIAIKR